MLKFMDERACIEGFIDILQIDESQVRLRFKTYQLSVKGKQLQIAAYAPSELILLGHVLSVTFVYETT